ncbi:UNKNOWN [Stylonychia lemnae]|uniref:Uncharacterized protein n=1 Tax=Stylonychia lemnae TaxID=5949 RepID=A0A078B6R2_STYLE|nr:UNKNOWN [Stylonychia lemnae]|eukprot:CDW88982.1 UNKNOWN [Stylonychia lemnae]
MISRNHNNPNIRLPPVTQSKNRSHFNSSSFSINMNNALESQRMLNEAQYQTNNAIFNTNYNQSHVAQQQFMKVEEEDQIPEDQRNSQSRIQFYKNLRSNKFVIVPGDEIIEEASKLNMPYFSIIEVPIKKYMLVKKQNEKNKAKSNIQSLRNSSQVGQGTIGLFRQINEESFKNMKKKFNQSPSIKVKKFKIKGDSDSAAEQILSQQYLIGDKINEVEEDPKLKIKSKLLGMKPGVRYADNNSGSSSIEQGKKKIGFDSFNIESLSFTDKIRTQMNKDLVTRLYEHEYDKLKQKILEEKDKEKKLKQITDKVQFHEGALSAKPIYRYEQFLERISRSPSQIR